MNTHDHSADGAPPRATESHDQHQVAIGRSRWVFGGFAAIALLMLAVEHRAHLLGWLPWIFLLACPLMHLFMHGGHGGHGARGDQTKPGSDK